MFNSEPNPAPRPAPTSVKTLRDAILILGAVLLWVMTTDANTAFQAVDFSHLATFSAIANAAIVAIAHGLVAGFFHGLVLGVKVLVFLAAGPTFFDKIGIVLTSAARFPTQFIADLRRAWTVRGRDCNDQPAPPTQAARPAESAATPTQAAAADRPTQPQDQPPANPGA